MAAGQQTLQITLKANTSQASSQLKNFQTNWTELKSKVDLAKMAFQEVAQAAQAVFEFGKMGAIVAQTAESFDLLVTSIGAAPDLFNQLKSAAGGTISDLELMSATATLLAGASGELATALANASPQLLEIARAANKLNPSLGDTAFLYESIATGIKRSSPLILDNLGIVVKVGEANEKYAAALGKTVGELTAAERSQALLNETLRAGSVLIEQAGGASGNAVDSFTRMEVALKNAGDAAKVRFAPFIAQAADAVFLLLEGQNLLNAALDKHGKELRTAGLSLEDYRNEILRAAVASKTLTASTADFVRHVSEGGSATFRAADASTSYIDSLGRQRVVTQAQVAVGLEFIGQMSLLPSLYESATSSEEEFTSATKINTNATKDNILAQERLTRILQAEEASMLSVGQAAQELAETFSVLDLNLNIGSNIEKILEQFEFLAAGGAELTAFVEGAMAAFGETGDLDALNQKMQDAFIWAQQIQVAIGNITAEEAAQNVANTLGMSLADALALVNGIVRSLNALDGSIIEVTVRVSEIFLDPDDPSGPKALGGPVTPGQVSMVGEAGPELFIPNQGGTVMNNSDLVRALQGGGGPVTVQVFLDGQEIGANIDIIQGRNVRNALGGAGVIGA